MSSIRVPRQQSPTSPIIIPATQDHFLSLLIHSFNVNQCSNLLILNYHGLYWNFKTVTDTNACLTEVAVFPGPSSACIGRKSSLRSNWLWTVHVYQFIHGHFCSHVDMCQPPDIALDCTSLLTTSLQYTV